MEGKYDTSMRLSQVIQKVIAEGNMSQQMLNHRVVSLWQVVMGPTVNRATRKVSFREGVLYVELYSSVVRQELIMMKRKIITSLNTTVGHEAIRDIVFS